MKAIQLSIIGIVASVIIWSLFLLNAGGNHSPDGAGHDTTDRLNVCQMQLSYSIGEIDPRFRISEQDVRKSMDAAIDIWSDAVETLQIRYSTQGAIVVNFVFDERQQMTQREKRLMSEIESLGSSIDRLQKEYDRYYEKIEGLSDQHRQLVDRVNLVAGGLNEWVENRNRDGGLTTGDLEYFENRSRAISELQRQEADMRNNLNALIQSFNPVTDRLNRDINEMNRRIDEYNQNFAGKFSFSSGKYEGRIGQGVITIYHHVNEQHRLLLLAHELGHALGLGHVSNPGSVMYSTIDRQLYSGKIRLTEQDREALRSQCR